MESFKEEIHTEQFSEEKKKKKQRRKTKKALPEDEQSSVNNQPVFTLFTIFTQAFFHIRFTRPDTG